MHSSSYRLFTKTKRRVFCSTVLAIVAAISIERFSRADESIDFARDIRPILSNRCFKCHGPDDDKREAGLRLDHRESAVSRLESGKTAIVPGNPHESELVARISSDDPDAIMPPPSTKAMLTAQEKKLLREWIRQEAVYRPHWAFVPPVKPAIPSIHEDESGASVSKWIRNDIDRFVLAKMQQEGLRPSRQADRPTLLRRIFYDLIGLPPTPQELDAFCQDTLDGAYERVVERLLASPDYGERWARKWLDLARYADTNGYEKDRPRDIWPYRDWVIRAIEADMPFDEFTIRQLAGDMLDNPTPDDLIATGFHRNTMLNEEGGIDPLEFRYLAMVDRVATTGTAWLGLTTGCAQCHTHKFDPITHTDYFRLMAMMNNADEPDYRIETPEVAHRREQISETLAERKSHLRQKWEVSQDVEWIIPTPTIVSDSGEKFEIASDGIATATSDGSAVDVYSVTLTVPAGTGRSIDRLRLEAIRVKDSGGTKKQVEGPGRTAHGNFVVSDVTVSQSSGGSDLATATKPVRLARAAAEFSQKGFDVSAAIDDAPETGWGIDGDDGVRSRWADFYFDAPLRTDEPFRLTITIRQTFGTRHTLGRFRLKLGSPVMDDQSIEVRRDQAVEAKFSVWNAEQSAAAISWNVAKPTALTSSMPSLDVQADGTILAGGDVTKSDMYKLSFPASTQEIRGIRLEVFPHESLPARGPGMTAYEGPKGDFFLSECEVTAGEKNVVLADASESFASGGNRAAAAIDGNMSSGWSTNGRQGRSDTAVFCCTDPIPPGVPWTLVMRFERHFACPLGCFRVSTSNAVAVKAKPFVAAVEEALSVESQHRTASQKQTVFAAFLQQSPELSAFVTEIDRLEQSLYEGTSTLVMRQRPASHPRKTHRHHRGEYLQPRELVDGGVPHFLSVPLPEGSVADRLSLAKWLVSPEHPLTARVTVNRHWAAFFGRGIVKTVEDFGYQSDPPSHPELLDALAIEFVQQGWSIQKLHRQIVMSSTYRQDSAMDIEKQNRDSDNVFLSRGPRVRLEAEQIRDGLLHAAGLLSHKRFGPGVRPPQPAGVMEVAYGGAGWNPSEGEDRYRRSIYTFIKRTAPFAMVTTFDGPTGENCVARREASNSPLQALTLLNDPMFLEMAQALSARAIEAGNTPEIRVREMIRRVLSREPSSAEIQEIVAFADVQTKRLQQGALDVGKLSGNEADGSGPEAVDRAVWMLVARVVMNLDETVVKR